LAVDTGIEIELFVRTAIECPVAVAALVLMLATALPDADIAEPVAAAAEEVISTKLLVLRTNGDNLAVAQFNPNDIFALKLTPLMFGIVAVAVLTEIEGLTPRLYPTLGKLAEAVESAIVGELPTEMLLLSIVAVAVFTPILTLEDVMFVTSLKVAVAVDKPIDGLTLTLVVIAGFVAYAILSKYI